MKVAVFRYYEHAVRSDDQSIANKLDRQSCVTRKNFVEQRRHFTQVIDDNDRDTHVVRQVLQEADVRV